jgi:CRISPR-associated exonuclease Cas4
MGRVVHESYYTRLRKEVEAEGMKIDVIERGGGIIYEVKTSSKFIDATRLQLGYYLWRLERMGVKARGVIAVPREKRKIPVSLDDDLRSRVMSALREISSICSEPLPPPPVKIPFCRRCAYRDFCWSVE